MGLGNLIQSYFYWRSWRRWFHPDRRAQLELIVSQLNEIDISARVVVTSDRVGRVSVPPRPFAPSGEELWQKEKSDGRQTSSY